MNEWKDVSSYSRGDTDRSPNAFEIRFGVYRLDVYRIRRGTAKDWYCCCAGAKRAVYGFRRRGSGCIPKACHAQSP